MCATETLPPLCETLRAVKCAEATICGEWKQRQTRWLFGGPETANRGVRRRLCRESATGTGLGCNRKPICRLGNGPGHKAVRKAIVEPGEAPAPSTPKPVKPVLAGSHGNSGCAGFAPVCRDLSRSQTGWPAHCSRKARFMLSLMGLEIYSAKVRSADWIITCAGMPGVGRESGRRSSSPGSIETRAI